MLAGGRIIVPGCEPTSYVSSLSLAYAFKNKLKCGTGYVSLKKALANIPGSTVKYCKDWGKGNTTTIFFVFPAIEKNCSCSDHIDYYAVLRGLATEDETITTSYDSCRHNDMGFCPSPDFDSIPPPERDPYVPENNAMTIAGGGVLPPLPPWQL